MCYLIICSTARIWDEIPKKISQSFDVLRRYPFFFEVLGGSHCHNQITGFDEPIVLFCRMLMLKDLGLNLLLFILVLHWAGPLTSDELLLTCGGLIWDSHVVLKPYTYLWQPECDTQGPEFCLWLCHCFAGYCWAMYCLLFASISPSVKILLRFVKGLL